MSSSVEQKIITAMMLLEMCERQDDPELLNKIDAAHDFVQSAFSEMRGGGEPVAVSDETSRLVAKIHADAAIADAKMNRSAI